MMIYDSIVLAAFGVRLALPAAAKQQSWGLSAILWCLLTVDQFPRFFLGLIIACHGSKSNLLVYGLELELKYDPLYCSMQ